MSSDPQVHRRNRPDPLSSVLSQDQPAAGQTFGEPTVAGVAPGMAPTVVQQGNIVHTARSIQVVRNDGQVKSKLKQLAAAFGDSWIYSWTVKDKRRNRETLIEGGTIKMANAIARTFGNCVVDVRSVDQGAHWLFQAVFVDLETGYNATRLYQQRKRQDMGMSDEQRQMDMIYQSGQSKAIRNVVLNALPDIAQFCLEEAKGALRKRINENPEKAREWIVNEAARLGCEVKRIETVYARTVKNWTVQDMARIYAELQSVAEGFISINDLYPLETDPKDVEPPVSTEKGPEPSNLEKAAAAVAAEKKADSKPPVTDMGEIDVVLDGKKIGTTSDANLQRGEPIVINKQEYEVTKRGEYLPDDKEDPVPAYHVKLLVHAPAPDPKPAPAADKPKAGPRKLFG